MVVGARGDNTKATSAGSTLVFKRISNSNYQFVQKLIPDEAAAVDNFGFCVKVSKSGNVIIASAPLKDTTVTNIGRIYFYLLDDDGFFYLNKYVNGRAITNGETTGTVIAVSDNLRLVANCYLRNDGVGCVYYTTV